MPTMVKVHARTVNKAKGIGVIIKTQPSVYFPGEFIAVHVGGKELIHGRGRNRENAIKRVLRQLGYNG